MLIQQEIFNSDYIHKGIAKRSFNLGWRIDSKFDLSKANAEFKDGLLTGLLYHLPKVQS